LGILPLDKHPTLGYYTEYNIPYAQSRMPMSINPLSPTQKAWLAGFIDGEGFIGITFQRKKETKQQSSTPRYHPFLIITNKNKASIFYIEEIRPYLKIKRKQCDLLLKYIEIRQKKVVVTGAGSRGSTSFSVEEEKIYSKLLALNKRGGNNEPSLS